MQPIRPAAVYDVISNNQTAIMLRKKRKLDQIVRCLKIHTYTVTQKSGQHISSGPFPSLKIGNSILFRLEPVKHHLKACDSHIKSNSFFLYINMKLLLLRKKVLFSSVDNV